MFCKKFISQVLPPAPPGPAPPPPIRPPNSVPPNPPKSINQNEKQQSNQTQELPSFVQRQERDTFGVRDNYREDSWGRAEAAKLDMVYETSKVFS